MRNTIDPVNLEIGERIKTLRMQKGWTQKKLALKAGVTVQTVLFIEKGKRGLSSYTIRSISSAFEVTADYILFGNGGPANDPEADTQAAQLLSIEEVDNTIEALSKAVGVFQMHKEILTGPGGEAE